MGKFIDMTGWVMKEHNIPDSKWTVLRKSDVRKSNKIYWICKCECGIIKDVLGSDLKAGKNKSCGCAIKEKGSPNLINELGNVHGRLTVIERAENDKDGEAQWKCLCSCGNTTIVLGTSLRNGNTQSCGCLHKEQLAALNFIDLTGKKKGLLTPLYPLEKRTDKGNIMWHCICDCGKYKDVLAECLQKEKTLSCGCLSMSHGEFKINQLLSEKNISFIQEYKPKDPNIGFDARFDFYLPELNTLIEFDGDQHFSPNEHFGGIEDFVKRVAHDKVKNEWAHKNGITIIRIPYTHYNELCIKDLMPETSNFILHKKIKYIPRQH